MFNPWQDDNNNLSAYERNRVLMNDGRGRFIDVSHLTTADLDSDSRGVAVGDLNGDGMEDVIVRNVGGGPLVVFENRWPRKHWLRVSLRGVASNRLGLGAKLKLEIAGRTLWRELYPVASYQSQLPSLIHFGLGDATNIERLTIYWPSGAVQALTDLAADKHVRITEGESRLSVISE